MFANIQSEITNLNFSNIKIDMQNINSTKHIGIISTTAAKEIKNLTFKNIEITAGTTSRNLNLTMGIIGISSGISEVNNINMSNITCKLIEKNTTSTRNTNYGNTGALIGRITNFHDVENITLEGSNITGSNYVGGIIGRMVLPSSYPSSTPKNLSVNSTTINGYTYVAGIIGYGHAKNSKSTNNIINGSHQIGGVIGYSYYHNGSSNLYASNNIITYNGANATNNYSSVGGITGSFAWALEKCVVENTLIANLNANTNQKSYSVGGIVGSGGVNHCSVENSIILAGNSSNVGGITGLGGSSGNYCINTIIEGADRVGGITGLMSTGNLYYSYTNAHITATDGSAGGLIGYLNNSNMNTATNTNMSQILRNYVANSYISAISIYTDEEVNLAGSLIGKSSAELHVTDTAGYYMRNLATSNIEKYVGGLVSENTVKNVDYSFRYSENYKVDLELDKIEEIKENIKKKALNGTITTDDMSNISIEFNATINDENMLYSVSDWQTLFNAGYNYWNYTSITEGYYPIFGTSYNINITVNGEEISRAGKVKLPKEQQQIALMSMFSLRKSVMPTYDIYVSDVNKINIEFSEANNNSYFRYEANGVISDTKLIENKVYTLEYDFITPLKLTIGNSQREEEVIINPTDISKKLSIVNDNYYYLQENTLNKTLDVLEGEYVNIYNDKALTVDGYIYNLDTNTKITTKTEGIKLLEESKPITEYTYSEKIIETYYNFSKVISSEAENLTDYQIFIKNGKIFALDGSLDICGDSIIIDAYNNKEYQTALGKDGAIYDFKEKINYPEDFENKNISSMTNNIDSECNEILVMYDDGRVYAFNYITGEILFDTDTAEEPSIFSELGSMVRSLFTMNRRALYSPEVEEYEEATELQEKLTDTSVEQAKAKIGEEKENVAHNLTNITTTNSTKENSNYSNEKEGMTSNVNNTNNISSNENDSYLTVYDSDSNKYLVYKTSSILSGTESDTKKIVSETEKIESDVELKEYYETANGSIESRKINGISLIIISISAIGIILIVMYKKKNYT